MQGLRSALPARCSSDEPLPLPASKTGLRSLTKVRRCSHPTAAPAARLLSLRNSCGDSTGLERSVCARQRLGDATEVWQESRQARGPSRPCVHKHKRWAGYSRATDLKACCHPLPQKRLQSELESRGLEASGNKPALVTRLHKALAAQQQPAQGTLAQWAAAQDRPAKANAELLQLRQRVSREFRCRIAGLS